MSAKKTLRVTQIRSANNRPSSQRPDATISGSVRRKTTPF